MSASPLMKHMFTPGGCHEYVKGFCTLAHGPLMVYVFACLGLVPATPKHPAAPEKNPLVTRVRNNTTLSQYLVFYSGH